MKETTINTIILIIISTLYTLIILYLISEKTQLKSINKITELNYDIANNYYTVEFIRNNDTLIIDYVHPIELDSLVKSLNK